MSFIVDPTDAPRVDQEAAVNSQETIPGQLSLKVVHSLCCGLDPSAVGHQPDDVTTGFSEPNLVGIEKDDTVAGESGNTLLSDVWLARFYRVCRGVSSRYATTASQNPAGETDRAVHRLDGIRLWIT
ncbi:MAG: hypothetical protein BGP03_26550 [Pseudonocardia sp. 73-21]|nr:MAG: hypothetical protein BGP03_26550 [Pseudonocardia sp. 73-21]